MKINNVILKERRIEKGYSLDYVSKELGYKDVSSVFYIENGSKMIPGNKLIKLAKMLDLELDDLIDSQ